MSEVPTASESVTRKSGERMNAHVAATGCRITVYSGEPVLYLRYCYIVIVFFFDLGSCSIETYQSLETTTRPSAFFREVTYSLEDGCDTVAESPRELLLTDNATTRRIRDCQS